jgi:ankyrin repeat protein
MTPKVRMAKPARTERRGFALRGGLLTALFFSVILAIAWRFWQPFAPSSSLRNESERNTALLAAIREGDQASVRSLLDQGADVNARHDLGDTALQQAALNADREMMRLLIQRGADVNAGGPQGDSVLLRAVHDPAKVKLLLDHGARVDNRAMLLAATLPGSRPTLELLLQGGGNVNADVGGVTALMCAAFGGDLEAVRFLLEHGAEVRARTAAGLTPLLEAALSGNAEIVQVLLDQGADANARYELPHSNGHFLTPVLAAVLQGHAACLQPLLDRGADVNVQGGPFERTALLCAATAGSEEIVRLLLAHGANVQAVDWQGDAPLAWARRRGETRIVQLLRQAGARGQEQDADRKRKEETEPTELPSPFTLLPSPVFAAVTRSLPLLQQSGMRFTSRVGCVSCHHQSLLARTTSLVRAQGFQVDERIAAQERAHVLAYLSAKSEIVLGQGLDPLLAPWTLWSLEAQGQQPSPVTDALVHYLVLQQSKDGSWKTRVYRPPSDASHFTFTALALRGLQRYAPEGRRAEIQTRIARARAWLRDTTALETEDKAWRLLGLHWAEADAESIREAVGLLLREQRGDGGWAQLPSLPSDAYATGEVLYALHRAGKTPVSHPTYQRGVAFLLRTQLADGSWFVPTRSFPLLEYFNSGFPHGRSQFISEAATCWATMALALTVPGAG